MNTSLYSTAQPATLLALLQERASQQPDDLAYRFLHFREQCDDESLTYRELDKKSRAIAAVLQNVNAAGERALLLYPSGLDYIAAFFGCLAAQVVGITAYPPHSSRMIPRIQAIVHDAQSTLVLTTTQIKANIQRWFGGVPELEQLEWLTTDDIDLTYANDWIGPDITPDTIAFLQYTSGSTSTPKGVMVSHRNLIHNLEEQKARFEHDKKHVNVSWLPIFHDLGLIAGVLQPLYVGFPAYLMAPVSFLQRPMRWLQTISMYRGTSSYAPNFAFELCMRRSTPEERAQLDLSSWVVAVNGAEPVRGDTLERFSEMFEPCGFRAQSWVPAYGLAEATLVVSSAGRNEDPIIRTFDKQELEQHHVLEIDSTSKNAHRLASCGVTLGKQKIVIAHPEKLTTCTPNEVGEIWVGGPSVALGYWQRPEVTEKTFQAYLADTGEGPFLRTGDLGFLQDEQLFITGRLKDVIIIHGRNHYPQDIELTTEHAHPAMRLGCSAAFSVDVDGEESLVVVAEVDQRYKPEPGESVVTASALTKAIKEAIAIEHDVQVHAICLLQAGGVQKTSSGKIQRSACRTKFQDGSLKLWVGQSEASQES